MLSKDVCFKCFRNYCRPLYIEIWIYQTFEQSWEDDRIDCSGGKNKAKFMKWSKTSKEIDPPACCPHRFEHAVAKGMKDAQ